MTTTKPKLLTADDLLRLDGQGVKGELIRGVLHEKVSSSIKHGKVVINVASELKGFVKPRRLGTIFGSDAGILLERDPDTVREPDVGFTLAERMPPDANIDGFTDIVPDLVVEVASPSDSRRAVAEKMQMWLAYGVRLVWVAWLNTRTIDVHPAGGPVTTLTEDDTLDGGAVLPGFAMPVREVFE